MHFAFAPLLRHVMYLSVRRDKDALDFLRAAWPGQLAASARTHLCMSLFSASDSTGIKCAGLMQR
jgi:hypothetical protein